MDMYVTYVWVVLEVTKNVEVYTYTLGGTLYKRHFIVSCTACQGNFHILLKHLSFLRLS